MLVLGLFLHIMKTFKGTTYTVIVTWSSRVLIDNKANIARIETMHIMEILLNLVSIYIVTECQLDTLL